MLAGNLSSTMRASWSKLVSIQKASSQPLLQHSTIWTSWKLPSLLIFSCAFCMYTTRRSNNDEVVTTVDAVILQCIGKSFFCWWKSYSEKHWYLYLVGSPPFLSCCLCTRDSCLYLILYLSLYISVHLYPLHTPSSKWARMAFSSHAACGSENGNDEISDLPLATTGCPCLLIRQPARWNLDFHHSPTHPHSKRGCFKCILRPLYGWHFIWMAGPHWMALEFKCW